MKRNQEIIFRLLVVMLGLFTGQLMVEAQEFKFVSAKLRPERSKIESACPIRVNFNGYIKTNGAGTIKYTFVRSDGATAPVYTLEFREAGALPIATDWTLGDASALPFYEGWQTLKILSPNEMETKSGEARFAIKCEP